MQCDSLTNERETLLLHSAIWQAASNILGIPHQLVKLIAHFVFSLIQLSQSSAGHDGTRSEISLPSIHALFQHGSKNARAQSVCLREKETKISRCFSKMRKLNESHCTAKMAIPGTMAQSMARRI
jgi:hypothetical protein